MSKRLVEKAKDYAACFLVPYFFVATVAIFPITRKEVLLAKQRGENQEVAFLRGVFRGYLFPFYAKQYFSG
nr:hypothetical protein MarFTME_219 [Marseillevirus futianmevirus]